MQAQQQLVSMIEQKNPMLQQIVEVKNEVAKLDMDIIIETSYDTVNIQREQFELLAKIAQTRPDVPFTEVIKLSELRGKDKIIETLESSAHAAQQAQQADQKKEMTESAVENKNTDADTVAKRAKARKDHADAEAQEIENGLIKSELSIVR